jgi:hypothetical protein
MTITLALDSRLNRETAKLQQLANQRFRLI